MVKKAEKNMIEKGENKEYLPIQGLDSFRKATVDLLLGDSPAVKEVGSCCLSCPLGLALLLQAGFNSLMHL